MVSDIKGHRLRVFENRELRRICGTETDQVTVGWKAAQLEAST
jgi:hypothetical protein